MSDPDFLPWLERHAAERPSLSLDSILGQSGGASGCAVVCVDLLEGFCREGPLSSERVGALIEPTCAFLKSAHAAGVSKFFFPSDCHPMDSPEFQSFPPHCVKGTSEAELVKELTALRFASEFVRVDKGSVSSLVGTDLAERISQQDVRTIVCIGDCTDLCLYHLAVGLRFWANAHGVSWRILVPQDLVATYDLPTRAALELGILPHPAGFLSDVFLYHLELNGVEVLSSIACAS